MLWAKRLIRCLFMALAAVSAPLGAVASDGLAVAVQFSDGDDVLIVSLHGDISIGLAANYHYEFAMTAGAAIPGASAYGLLRPGYFDRAGRRSPGSALGRKDNYTREAVDMIALTIQRLRRDGGYRHVVAVGHSGGAAIIATAMDLHPGVIDSAVLVSCPCNVPDWRRHVLSRRPRREAEDVDWRRSLSPHRHIAAIAEDARIVAITSGTDLLTPPGLARGYVAALRERGLNARFVETEEPGHFLWNLTNSVLREVRIEVDALRARAATDG